MKRILLITVLLLVGLGETDAGGQLTNRQCSDGIDNDNDSFVDFPADPDCVGVFDDNESIVPQCSDGIDNDGDGFVDFPADPSCINAFDDSEADLPQCSDSVDNDGDGFVDFPADPGCVNANDSDETDIPVMLPTVGKSGLVTLMMILAAFGAFAIYHYPQRKISGVFSTTDTRHSDN